MLVHRHLGVLTSLVCPARTALSLKSCGAMLEMVECVVEILDSKKKTLASSCAECYKREKKIRGKMISALLLYDA